MIVLALLATGCSEAADIDGQQADAVCEGAAGALESIVLAADRLQFDDEAVAALDSIAAEIDGTDLASLIDSMSSALVAFYTPLEDDRVTQLERLLEVRHSTSEVGLWCASNASPSVAEEVLQLFASRS